MKKTIIAVLLLIAFAAIFTGCSAKADPNFNYRVTGHFAGWGSNYEEKYMMTPVSISDKRIAPLKDALKGAQYIYIYEHSEIDRANPTGEAVRYEGYGVSLDLIYAIKFIRLVKDSSEPSGWAHDAWMPSTEVTGFRSSLSPDTIIVGMDRSDEAAAAAGDGLGSVNGNPLLLKGARPYYIVLAIFKDKSRGIGAVVK